MISKTMYKMLSALPRDCSEMSYSQLVQKSGLTKDEFIQCRIANQFLGAKNEGLFYTTGKVICEEEIISLSDRGLAEVEQFEQQIESEKATEKSICLAKLTLYCAIATLFAAIVTLVVTVIK
ncbi:MAG: hypothetical protein IJV40_14595 [Oscillospiraceae bacterium]|nr:hypothetical protein [Oscillospiraceae bacterium]